MRTKQWNFRTHCKCNSHRSTTPRTIGRWKKSKKSSIFACAVYYLCLNLKTRVCTKFNSVAKVTPFPTMTYSGRNKFEVSHRSPTTLFVFSLGQKQLTCHRRCYSFVLYYVLKTTIKCYTHHKYHNYGWNRDRYDNRAKSIFIRCFVTCFILIVPTGYVFC